jgi:dTDP-4-dehydrorhamnose reductase
VVNAAGWVRVDEAESEPGACFVANAEGAARLARLCAERDMAFVGFSSDLVFDGRSGVAYVERDAVSPLNVYGASKAEAERAVLAAGGRPLMIRTAAFFSPYDPHNFAAHVLRTLAAGHELTAAADLIVSPTYVPDLVDATLDLLIDGETGLRHLANPGAVSWATFARRLARELRLDERLVRDAAAADFGGAAARPAYAPLATERGEVMPELENAVARWGQIVRETEFAAEAEALIDGRTPQPVEAPRRPRF